MMSISLYTQSGPLQSQELRLAPPFEAALFWELSALPRVDMERLNRKGDSDNVRQCENDSNCFVHY